MVRIKKTTPKTKIKPSPKKAVLGKNKKLSDGRLKVGQKIFMISIVEGSPIITQHKFKGYRENAGWGDYDDDQYGHLNNMYPTKAAAQKALKPSIKDQLENLKQARDILVSRIKEIDDNIKNLQ